ncbi:MAG: ChaN family lipoprotein [Thiobacillaceae bacterium]
MNFLLCLLPSIACSQDNALNSSPCGQAGQWLGTDSHGVRLLSMPSFIDHLASQKVVLLGERHDSAEDHRWQLQTLAQLFSRHPDMAIGLEMFPRRVQPLLDRWVAGGLSQTEFLKLVDWKDIWNYDPNIYLPLFNFARMNRIPMLALNVEHSLVEQVGRLGWDSVPEAQKEGVTRPAQPDSAYVTELHEIFEHHPARAGGEGAFPRFVEAQTVWDRAMAQAIANFLKQHPKALVAGIMGSGHVRNGFGVPNQLKDLGVDRVSRLLTLDVDQGCGEISPVLADAVYLVNPSADNPPRLGVSMEPDPNGIRIAEVVNGSVAANAGLRAGDLITEVAGRPVKSPEDLRAAVMRQAPGTWLPLKVRRGFFEMEMVARFPADS